MFHDVALTLKAKRLANCSLPPVLEDRQPRGWRELHDAVTLRFSIGATTTEADVDEAVRRILYVYNELGGNQPFQMA